MAADGLGRATLYLASCDPHERTPDGEPLVANGELKSPKGHPALVWGCGPLIQVQANKPRWVVLAAEDHDVEVMPWGALVRKGRVRFDGELKAAVRYMVEQSPIARPYISQIRRAEVYDVLAVGSLGHIDAKAHLVGAAGTDAKVKAEVGSVIAVGLRSHVKAGPSEKDKSNEKTGSGDFCIVAAGDNSTLEVGRFCTASVGNAGKVTAKAGAVVAGASLTDIVIGACGRALVESAGSIDLGEQAVGVGTVTTHFRGENGAVFVAINAIDGGETCVVTARVGVGDIKEKTWYVFHEGKFVRADA